jgi:uncharacterized protein YecE (DUF72 family)
MRIPLSLVSILERFLAEVTALEAKLGPLLVQLPPSLAFDGQVAGAFFASLRTRFPGSVVCEPRHLSWFGSEAERVLKDFHVARVAADPALGPEATHAGGWTGLVYYRLHGSPPIYYSAYSDDALKMLAQNLSQASQAAPVWCVFDNTALGAATDNALSTTKRLTAEVQCGCDP